MSPLDSTRRTLGALADFLDARRSSMLESWRDTVDADPELDVGSDWSVKQFNDHFPDVLESLSRALRAWPELSPSHLGEEYDLADSHARARWIQGYSLRGVMREWGHFNAVVLDRISAYPEFREGGAALRHALAVWARLLNDQQSRSALEYHQLERAEAETRGAELARVLDALRSGARMRGSAIEQLASGVRNDLQVVMTTGALESGQWHEAYALRKLSRESFNSIDEALTNMVTLAHLEAGHEVRRIEPFDAAPGLALLVEGFRHVASEAGITLDAAGPDSLPVCGDAERVRRVARHLLLCALRAPSPSPVVVRWHESPRADSRWHLLVEHAIAPGSADGGTEAGRALAASTDALQQVVGVAPTGNESALQNGSIPVGAGDGVDLLIAKHLCDVLGASIEVEADASVLRYRVSLPMTYA